MPRCSPTSSPGGLIMSHGSPVLRHATISDAKRVRANVMFAGRTSDEFFGATQSSVDPSRFILLEEPVFARTGQLLECLGG